MQNIHLVKIKKTFGDKLTLFQNEGYIQKKTNAKIIVKTKDGKNIDFSKDKVFAIWGETDKKSFASAALKKPEKQNLTEKLVCICSKTSCDAATKSKCAAAKTKAACDAAVPKLGCKMANANGSVQLQVLAILLALI